MKIYLVKRTGEIGYDEYDGHVVYANSESDARMVAKSKAGDEGTLPWDEAEVTEVGKARIKTTGIILSSFNAG